MYRIQNRQTLCLIISHLFTVTWSPDHLLVYFIIDEYAQCVQWKKHTYVIYQIYVKEYNYKWTINIIGWNGDLMLFITFINGCQKKTLWNIWYVIIICIYIYDLSVVKCIFDIKGDKLHFFFHFICMCVFERN